MFWGVIAIHRFVGINRRRLALALGIASLCLSVVAAHAGTFSMDHMAEPAAVCLAIAGGAIAAGAAAGARITPFAFTWQPVAAGGRPSAVYARPVAARTRAGPVSLQVFLL